MTTEDTGPPGSAVDSSKNKWFEADDFWTEGWYTDSIGSFDDKA
jgi:hypothetical protein